MSSVFEITEQTFATEVLASNRPVFIDYWADWCEPCRHLAPVIDELSARYPQVKFCKVDTNTNATLAARQGVMSLPTLQVIVGGEVVASQQGSKTKAGLVNMLSPYLE